MTTWTMDPRWMPNGTVLFLGISYATVEPERRYRTELEMRGRTEPKVYTYVVLKQAGVWYFSGSGKVPQAAGWGAVERWLARDNRVLEWVKIVSALEDIYPARIEGEQAAQVIVDDPSPELTGEDHRYDPRDDDSPGL